MFWQQRLYGYRVIVYVRAERLYLQSRSGADLTSHFPELQTAAADIGEDLVLDGELVVLHEDRLDFAALQQRARLGGFRARSVARVRPAHVVTIGLLEADGEELLASPYRGRWARLETLFTGRKMAGRWALVGSTPTARRRWPRAVSVSRAWSRNRPPTATGPARGLVEGPVAADGEAVVGRRHRDGDGARHSAAGAVRLGGRPAETRRTPHSGRARPPLDRRSVQLSLGSEGSVGTRPSRASLRRGVRQRHLHGRCGPVPASRRLRTTARGPHPGYGAASG
ncbi:ATP-dependent DNA ligase [Streptomyces sp. KR2]|uniref:ATP-dependent DNA ligase n=1 Tax=Streptomyces sp. KR2 TaxID=1514824 RepID=UPI003F802D60